MNHPNQNNPVPKESLENGALKDLVQTLYANTLGFIDQNGKAACHQNLPLPQGGGRNYFLFAHDSVSRLFWLLRSEKREHVFLYRFDH